MHGVAGGQIPDLYDVHEVNDGGSQAKDSDGDHRRLAKTIAPGGSANSQDANGQVGEANFKLKGVKIPVCASEANNSNLSTAYQGFMWLVELRTPLLKCYLSEQAAFMIQFTRFVVLGAKFIAQTQ